MIEMGQIPLIFITRYVEILGEKLGDVVIFNTIGNLIFWISFTIGISLSFIISL
jgi:hypothetical protein